MASGLLLAALLLAGGAASAPAPCPEPTPSSGRHGHLLTDVGVALAGSAVIAFAKPDIRRALLHDARLSNVLENFAHPVRQVRIGTRRDTDPFWVNDVAHPGLFALEALYLKRRGYGNGSAFLFTQVHSIVWEFAIEGSAFEPSGKDLLADAGGAALGLFVLHPVASRAGRRLAEGRGRFWDHVLRWLDPVQAISGGGERRLAVTPMPIPGGFGVQVSAKF